MRVPSPTPDVRGSASREAGFGLVEIVVSMFLIAMIAIAFLPLLIQGLQLSAANSTIATATQLVNDQLEVARAETLCANIVPASQTATDARGVELLIVREVGTCPTTGYPATVSVAASATIVETGAEIARADTLIYVEGP